MSDRYLTNEALIIHLSKLAIHHLYLDTTVLIRSRGGGGGLLHAWDVVTKFYEMKVSPSKITSITPLHRWDHQVLRNHQHHHHPYGHLADWPGRSRVQLGACSKAFSRLWARPSSHHSRQQTGIALVFEVVLGCLGLFWGTRWHSWKKCFCLREPVFWGSTFLILRLNFPNFEAQLS